MIGRTLACLGLLVITACRPATITEAEAKGDVTWLEQNGTPDAMAALGRLADKNRRAVVALESRSTFDPNAFKAAWDAVLRGAPWGTTMLSAGLADPKRADLAAGAMAKHDPHLVPFVGELEKALERLSASIQNLNVSSTLASVGAPASDAVRRRLLDPSTRGAMCRGIATKDAAPEARAVLLSAPVEARDAPECVGAVVHLAEDDDAALDWLAEKGEPGLLVAAGKEETLDCARLHVVWAKALAVRPAAVHPALTVPLGYAVKRCTAEMDGVLADAIVHHPTTRAVVVEAIDPFEGYGSALHATCAALPAVASGRDATIIRERASDALTHACKAPG